MNARRLGLSIATLLWTMQALGHAHLFGTNMPTVFYCSDDRDAIALPPNLSGMPGLQLVDAGPLEQSS